MIMCVLLCYPLSIHMSQLLSTGRPISSVTVTGKHGSNYRLSLSCNRKSKKLNLTNLFNSQQ